MDLSANLFDLSAMSTSGSELERLSIFWRQIARPQATDRII